MCVVLLNNSISYSLKSTIKIIASNALCRYFLEEVAFGHIADYALEVTRKNVTSAIRAAIQPYVQYRNRSDPHFPPTAGWLDDGRFFAIIVPFVDGLDKALQKVNSVWTEPNTGALMVTIEHTLHNINGTFNLHVVSRLSELQHPSRVVDFFMDRVRLSITYDVLRPNCFCSAIVNVYKMTTRPRDSQDDTGHLPIVAAAFANSVKDHLSNGTCSAIAKTNKYGTNPCH